MSKLAAFIHKMRSGFHREAQIIEPEFEIRDLATCMGEIDWTTLDVIHWTPAWMTPAERLLLYTLVFSLRPKRYLEIGTLNGGSALIVSAAMDAVHTDGRLVCVDPKPQIDPDHWKQLERRATLLKGFSPDILPRAYETVGGLFDFVFIDGDHSYTGVKRDASGVLPFVTEGAYLLFHDSFSPDVARAINSFVAQHRAQVSDFGTLTREFTTSSQHQESPSRWGGLRLVQVWHNDALRTAIPVMEFVVATLVAVCAIEATKVATTNVKCVTAMLKRELLLCVNPPANLSEVCNYR